MPDRVEEILKKIHVLFAKSKPYQDSPDQVIISKKAMFALLEDLNEALDAVLDQYEATTRSRERARLEMDRQAAEVVAQAKRDSDDVHAASLLYTDTMLDDVREVIDKTTQNIKHELIELMAALEERTETLEKNKQGVRDELTELHESELYVEALEKLRKKKEAERESGEESEEDVFEEAKAPKQNIVIRVDAPGSNAGISHSTRYSRNKAQKKEKKPANNGIDDEEITLAEGVLEESTKPAGGVYSADDFDLDAEYEQWRDGENPPGEDEKPKKGLFGGLFGKDTRK